MTGIRAHSLHVSMNCLSFAILALWRDLVSVSRTLALIVHSISESVPYQIYSECSADHLFLEFPTSSPSGPLS